jgi:hypothetical protein
MYDTSNKLGIQYIYGSDSNSGPVQFGSALSTGVWQHHAFVRNGNTLTVYTNGTSVGTHDLTGITFDISGLNTSGVTPLKMTIGAMPAGTGAYNGWLDEIRISNIARYTAAFTPSTTPFTNDANTLLLIHANGVDASTSFFDDTGSRTQKGVRAINGAALSTTQSKFGGSSLYFDGTNDIIEVFPVTDFQFASNNFTMEAWVYSSGTTSGFDMVMGQWGADGTQNSTFLALSGVTPVFYCQSDASTQYTISSSANITQDAWHHLAVTRSGNTITLWVNGVSRGTTTVTVQLTVVGNEFQLGASDNGNHPYIGYIDEVRVSSIARYTAGFTPSTTPFQNDANTILLIHADGTNGSTVLFDDNGIAPYTP